MLAVNDRLVIRSGACSFRGPGGQIVSINGHSSWQRPLAHVDPIVIFCLGGYLARAHACTTRVDLLGERHFEVIFTSALSPYDTHDPPMFEVLPADMDSRCAESGRSPVSDLSSLVNSDGAKTIGWVLETLSSKPFSFTCAIDCLRWCPPVKTGGYESLNKPSGAEASLQDMALARLASHLRGGKR